MVQEEKSMRKKSRGIVILLAVLTIFLLVYAGLRMWNGEQDKKEEEEQEAARVYVTDTPAEDIVSMKISVGNGDLEFEKENGTWYYTPDKDFPLQQSYPEDMAETAGAIEAERELIDGDSLADYGLDEPSYTIEYTDADGSLVQVKFGDMTGDDYYVTVGDQGIVYTVAGTVFDTFNYALNDLAQLDTYPSIGSGNLVKEVITENGVTTTYDSADEEQAEDITAIAGGLGAVTLSETADYSVDDADLPGYGLDGDARTTVEVTYTEDETENVITLYIGTQDGSGNRYVMINDSRIVYLISEEICNNILNI